MQTLRDPIETIHVYMVSEEEERKPYVLVPLVLAVFCLLTIVSVTVYSGKHPLYEHTTLRVPAIFLPPKHFSLRVSVIPTGVKSYPATFAYGTLTITNGSVVSFHLPQGLIFTASSGSEVITTDSVDVPAGNGTSYGVSYVQAKSLSAGVNGNISPLAIDDVYGTSLYIRNYQAFKGGEESYSKAFIQPQDINLALSQARNILIQHTLSGMLYRPCSEKTVGVQTLQVSWICQFITYAHVQGKVVSTKVQGKFVVLEVENVARPGRFVIR
jgi:hypothetical protein